MSTPTSDEIFTSPQPKSVEQLVAESNGQAAPPTPIDIAPTTVTAAPNLDPVPSAPPPAPTPPGPPTPEPTPTSTPTPEVAPPVPEPGTDVAVPEASIIEIFSTDEAPEPWDHETIEFMGDTLNVRKPTDQALGGFSLASSKYIKVSTRNDISGLFIARHISPRSYDRVFSRLMDPDDTEYTAETIGHLMAAVVALRGD